MMHTSTSQLADELTMTDLRELRNLSAARAIERDQRIKSLKFRWIRLREDVRECVLADRQLGGAFADLALVSGHATNFILSTDLLHVDLAQSTKFLFLDCRTSRPLSRWLQPT